MMTVEELSEIIHEECGTEPRIYLVDFQKRERIARRLLAAIDSQLPTFEDVRGIIPSSPEPESITDEVERVAQAICPWYGSKVSDETIADLWENLAPERKNGYRQQARAAILAMRPIMPVSGEEWKDMDSAPRGESGFVCRRKTAPHITFEACIEQECESWEMPQLYDIITNLTNENDTLDDDWRTYEWKPMPKLTKQEDRA